MLANCHNSTLKLLAKVVLFLQISKVYIEISENRGAISCWWNAKSHVDTIRSQLLWHHGMRLKRMWLPK